MENTKPAPKRSHKKSAPTAAAPTSSAVPEWMVDALAKQESDYAAAVAAAVAAQVDALRATDAPAADLLAKSIADRNRPAPRPNARQLLADVSFEERRLAWSVAALEQDQARIIEQILTRIKHGVHAGGVGNQRATLHGLDSSGCLTELAVIDLLLRTLQTRPEVAAAVALITPLEDEVAQLDAAAEERRQAIQAAEVAHEELVRAARAAADKAIESSPEVAASNLKIFELMHSAAL